MKLVSALMLAGLAMTATADARTPLPAAELPAQGWTPEGQTRAHILGLHSFGDYHAAFAHLGPWFARRGIAVHAYDQRGFGGTKPHGHWAGTDRMVRDALVHARRLRADGAQRIYLMGESMGGAVAMLAAVRAPELIDGLILAAPAVREGIWIRYIYNAGLSVVATVAPGATVEVERNADNPALRPATARRLARDPRVVSEVRMDTYQGLIDLADRASNKAPEIEVPVLLLFGGRDESVPEVSIQHLRDHLGEKVSFRLQEDAPHLLLQSRHWRHRAGTITDWLNPQIPGPRKHAAAEAP
jgi:acylglycerol lipase